MKLKADWKKFNRILSTRPKAGRLMKRSPVAEHLLQWLPFNPPQGGKADETTQFLAIHETPVGFQPAPRREG